jgi:hypothetical protein
MDTTDRLAWSSSRKAVSELCGVTELMAHMDSGMIDSIPGHVWKGRANGGCLLARTPTAVMNGDSSNSHAREHPYQLKHQARAPGQ